jgi:hypothetical protein
MVVGDTDLIPTDEAVLARLEGQLSVDVIGHEEAQPEDADGKALVIITSSATVPFTGTKFRDARVPLILLEPNLMGLMRLTDEPVADHGATQRTETEIRIVDDEHPLAAGLDGDVTVYETPWRLTWGVPAPDAVKIATVVDDPDHVVIFAYQTGDEMVGSLAPAKRLAFFLHDNQQDDNLTDDAVILLDAAIRWMLE